jgi:hypothetical protein
MKIEVNALQLSLIRLAVEQYVPSGIIWNEQDKQDTLKQINDAK